MLTPEGPCVTTAAVQLDAQTTPLELLPLELLPLELLLLELLLLELLPLELLPLELPLVELLPLEVPTALLVEEEDDCRPPVEEIPVLVPLEVEAEAALPPGITHAPPSKPGPQADCSE